MAKPNCMKEDLRRKIRECSLSGGEVLRSLDKAVGKLEDFVRIMQPLQETINKLGEASSSIDKTLSQVRDLAQVTREGHSLVREIQNPADSRHHLKNLERAQTLFIYFQTNPDQQDSDILVEGLEKALKAGYVLCIKFFEEQVTKYNEIFGISHILQENSAQVDMIDIIKELVEICKVKAPQYWGIYIKLRSILLHKNVSIANKIPEPYIKGSHTVIKVLENFVKCCSAEKELLICILGTSAVQD